MHITLWVEPVAASRPRVARNGRVYYQKRYDNFRKLAWAALGEMSRPKGCPLSCPLEVELVFYCRTPKNPSNSYPIGDIDNYQKGVLDVLNEWAWQDDVQICKITAQKKYAEQPRIEVWIREHNVEPVRIRKTRGVSEVR
jgi:Holliday junction resolvase RusA-like endonuclease